MKGKMWYSLIAVLVAVTTVLSACGTPAAPATPVTIIQTKEVQVPVVVTATSAPQQAKLEIFHWWTAPGEREAADAMFKAFKDAYPDIEVVENPVPGGG